MGRAGSLEGGLSASTLTGYLPGRQAHVTAVILVLCRNLLTGLFTGHQEH
jgi:hypothetical protein